MLVPTAEQFRQHEINYLFEHFRHLLTEEERTADDVVTFLHEGDHGWELSFNSLARLDFSVAQIQAMLRNGFPVFRQRVAERLFSTHREEIYSHTCPNCGYLPAPPKAKHCVWCSGDWYESRLDQRPAAIEAAQESEDGTLPLHSVLTEAQKEHVEETDGARFMDWILEVGGTPFGLLTDCRFQDMFWYNYQITFISDDAELQTKFNALGHHYTELNPVWRTQKHGIEAKHAFPAARAPTVRGERIIVRGMNFDGALWIAPVPEPEPKDAREKVLRWLKKYLFV